MTRGMFVCAMLVGASCAVDDLGATLGKDDGTPTEEPYFAQSCDSSYLLSSPTANQCCYTNGYAGGTTYTLFVRQSDAKVIKRFRNPYGTGCKLQDGVSSCAGDTCYYGPFGFGKAIVIDDGATPVIWSFSNGYNTWCDFYGSGTPVFANVTGTNATGVGCPGANGSEYSTAWDY